jgi:MYXO-CTERM domain-containing protein
LISLLPVLVAHLAAAPASGAAPLVVGFDTARSQAGTIAEHLVLVGNGDAIGLANAEQTSNYNFTLPGFYLAQSWLRDDSGIGLSAAVPIAVSRERDGQLPPAATVAAQATTDPSTFAFTATVTAQPNDPIAAQRWDFGDGNGDGADAPFHTYAHAGVYQAALVATTRAGLRLDGRTVVVVRDAGGALAPSLLMTVSPQDSSLLTPVTVTAYVLGVAPDAKVTSAEVAWPDLIDASPTVTPTTAGLTVTSQHALATPGSYDVPVTVQLAAQMAPVQATVRVTVANIDDSAPSPVLLTPPSSVATVGVAYSPGTASGALVVAGDGPFAFGADASSPRGFSVDGDGHLAWTPARDQLGFQRLAVRIVDAQGRETVDRWVVEVTSPKSGGCALVVGAPSSSSSWPLVVAIAAVVVAWRRRRATA